MNPDTNCTLSDFALIKTIALSSVVIASQGLDFLGYGYNAKVGCKFEQCQTLRLISLIQNESVSGAFGSVLVVLAITVC